MNRNEFMKSLEQHYPDDMNDEQLDALEQFSFKLFDAGYAEDKVDILLANEGLNKLLTSNHDEHKARFLKISELKQRNAELEAQLVEVNNNRTGVAPCARFCEALAAKKMFDNLQTRNAELMAQAHSLVGADAILCAIANGLASDPIAAAKCYVKGFGDKLAEHNIEVAARAVETALNLYAREVYRADELPFKQAEYVIDSAAAFAEQYANKIKSGEVQL